MKRALLFLLAFLLCASGRAASGFSYVYIQGDKQTPFYVKVEDAMQPRFGKNYCIIPQLAAGETHIQILFQQNAFPAQNFTVNIPEGGSRGFLLVHKESLFSLYDLQNGIYLQAGNTTDDYVVSRGPGTQPPAQAATVTKKQAAEPVAADIAVPKKEKRAKKTPVKKAAPEPAESARSGDPVFISGIELGNKGAATASPRAVEASGSPTGTDPGLPAILNTDCPAPIQSDEFSTIFHALNTRESDEDRVDYLSGQMNHCYTSWMARTLTMRLQSDAARFSLLKRIYPRITDQGAFPLLDDLLTADAWKEEFAKLVHH